jgi:hypothetical protein
MTVTMMTEMTSEVASVSVMGHLVMSSMTVVSMTVVGHMSVTSEVTSMMGHVVTSVVVLIVVFDFDCLGGNCDCGCKGDALEHGVNL